MKELPNMRNLMTELDNNVFIQKWHCFVHDYFMSYYIYYIDGSKSRATFTKESTEEEIKPQLLYLIDKDLREKGWVHREEPKEEYDPADDPYYKNEDLYIPKDIN